MSAKWVQAVCGKSETCHLVYYTLLNTTCYRPHCRILYSMSTLCTTKGVMWDRGIKMHSVGQDKSIGHRIKSVLRI